MQNAVKVHQITADTPMRITIDGRTLQTRYGLLLGAFNRSIGALTNQVFVMVYGNLEAFFTDVVADALEATGSADPLQESLTLVMGARWKAKLDRVANRLDVPIHSSKFASALGQFRVQLFGQDTTDALEFLQGIADLRHRLVHTLGRADEKFIERYPNSGLVKGALMQVPPSVPFDLNMLFVAVTDFLDSAFAIKFTWPRTSERPESLIEPELKIL